MHRVKESTHGTPRSPMDSPGLSPLPSGDDSPELRPIASGRRRGSSDVAPRRTQSDSIAAGGGKASHSKHSHNCIVPPAQVAQLGTLPPFDTSDLAVAASKVGITEHDEAWWKELHAKAIE